MRQICLKKKKKLSKYFSTLGLGNWKNQVSGQFSQYNDDLKSNLINSGSFLTLITKLNSYSNTVFTYTNLFYRNFFTDLNYFTLYRQPMAFWTNLFPTLRK